MDRISGLLHIYGIRADEVKNKPDIRTKGYFFNLTVSGRI